MRTKSNSRHQDSHDPQGFNERTFHAKNAHKLDDPDRLVWLPPGDVIASLRLADGMAVADIGAGTGYFAIPMARAIGKGRVAAVDFQPDMLSRIREKLQHSGEELPIDLAKGDAEATGLDQASMDVVLIANVWHELDHHAEVLSEVRRIIRNEGRLAILDWRTDVTQQQGPPLDHRISVDTVTRVLKEHRWMPAPPTTIGRYHYLIQASPARS